MIVALEPDPLLSKMPPRDEAAERAVHETAGQRRSRMVRLRRCPAPLETGATLTTSWREQEEMAREALRMASLRALEERQ